MFFITTLLFDNSDGLTIKKIFSLLKYYFMVYWSFTLTHPVSPVIKGFLQRLQEMIIIYIPPV